MGKTQDLILGRETKAQPSPPKTDAAKQASGTVTGTMGTQPVRANDVTDAAKQASGTPASANTTNYAPGSAIPSPGVKATQEADGTQTITQAQLNALHGDTPVTQAVGVQPVHANDAVASARQQTRDLLGDTVDSPAANATTETSSPATGTGNTAGTTTAAYQSLLEDDDETKAWQAKQDAARADFIAALEEEAGKIDRETPEEKKKREKRERRSKLFSAIGDGISALSNLYFTTKGAPSMYDPSLSLSKRNQERIDRLRKEREENLERWRVLQAQRMGMLDDAVKQRRAARKEQATLLLQAQKADREAREAEAKARLLEQQGNNYAAQIEYNKARAAREQAETAKKQAEAKEAESNAKYADSKNQSIVERNKAAAGASNASAQNSRSSAAEHAAKTEQIRSGKDSSTKPVGHLEGKPYYNQNDYNAAVVGRAKELGINTSVQGPTGKKDTFGDPEYSTRRKTTAELAAEIEARGGRQSTPSGNGGRLKGKSYIKK